MRTWLSLLCACVALTPFVVPTVAAGQISADFPLGVGLRSPGYDRVDGLVVPYGPTVTAGDDLVTIDPRLTYRSQLGKIDPALTLAWHPAHLFSLSISGERGTFTNDSWIRPGLTNALYSFGLGADSRNYFRADRTEGKVSLNLPTGNAMTSLYTGVRFENDWSTGWRVNEPAERDAPYSFLHWHDTVDGMERPNPLIDPGHIASALLGGESHYDGERLTNAASLLFEAAWHTPLTTNFQQITLDDRTKLRTWAGERLELVVHAVTTTSGPAPAQRDAYVGGSGTIAMTDLLSLGGDHLYFVDALYDFPVPGVSLPMLGQLFFAPHFTTGAAGIGGFGAPAQNVGVRLHESIVTVDLLENPRTHQHELGVGLDVLHSIY